MDESATSVAAVTATPAKPKPKRWRRIAKWMLIVLGVVLLCVAYSLKDYYRTLASLRKIPGTKAYVMDYYLDYHLDEVRAHGIDVKHVDDSVVRVLLPKWTLPVAMRVKASLVPTHVEAMDSGEHCSTVVLHPSGGHVYFGRNLDYFHDACLILKIHGQGGTSSIAVLDLKYLNLDRGDLDKTSLLARLPLLFTPYYLQDGMNQYGVAVSDMAVHGVKAPYDPGKPNVIHSLAMRLILDDAKNVDEAVALLKQYNIYFVMEKCHLMVADASGKSEVVEFIGGEIKTTPTDNCWQVCTNHQICGTSEAESDAKCWRYRTATEELAGMGSTVGGPDVMKVMESVAQKNFTMWSSVYDLSNGDFRFAYRRHYGNDYTDHLDLLNAAPTAMPVSVSTKK